MSQNTTLKPFLVTASAVEIQVFVGTITSLSFFKFKDSMAISSASVPFPTPTQYFELVNFAKFFSKVKTSFPPTKEFFLIKFEMPPIIVL